MNPLIQLISLRKVSILLSIGNRFFKDSESNYAEYDGTWITQVSRIQSISAYALAIRILGMSVIWLGFIQSDRSTNGDIND